MELNEAETLAHRLLTEHGLTARGWMFAFDRATKRLGATHYGQRRITLSSALALESDAAAVEQVLLHELAHALLPECRRDGSALGHGPEWRRLARELGYRGGRTMGVGVAVSRPVRAVRPRLGQMVEAGGRRGVVVKVGRTQAYFRDADGAAWVAHFEHISPVAPGVPRIELA